MEIRKFRTTYGLELIPASHQGIILGDLVWDPLLGPPEFSRKGMPNSIFTAFLDASLIDEKEWKKLREGCRDTPLVNARLATRTVEVEREFLGELHHPATGRISNELHLEKVSKITFGNIQVAAMDDVTRIRTDGFLEQMKATRWSEYDGRIRRVFLITELYYGSLRMVVERQLSSELDALAEKAGLNVSEKSEGEHATVYEFSHDQVPFAMRIERVRTFNG